ncbi:BTAD domain-containing putative transcriptional regulator [Actinoplanes sp. NPDC051859]|uniref:AfsR/SARP family transcriptional regulator n=1 Tax=Actinoplanes sp. NPDC051859 TaxID=3363909 RepID=UPI0037B61156
MTDVELRLLGAVEAQAGAERLQLGPRKQRLVLAVLALEVNRAVPVDRLVDLAWPVAPPRTAGHAIQVCVSGLRGAFAGRDGIEIRTEGPGYLLDTDPQRIDVHRFRALLAQAGDAACDEARTALLDQALGLWGGAPLHGVATPEVAHRLGAGLVESRLAAIEDRLDAGLRLGRHRELVDELTDLTATEPQRERPATQLMLALYRSGRPADALGVARATRQVLADQLGLDPGLPLQRLELAIMRQDPALAWSAPAPKHTVPAQLPGRVAGFAGREAQLAELDELLAAGERSAIVIIGGTAGSGKTALAVQWAQRHRERFPDGQLHINLNGYGGSPVQPAQALATFLRALGVPAEQVPVDVIEAEALFRTLVAERRLLVLLDNAACPDQVRPLLPGGAHCVTLVTSRDRLTGLIARDGARPLTLGELTPSGAAELLTGLVGARAVDDPAATAELARLCGHLPLALRIAAAHLLCRPRRPAAELVAELADGNRLTMLAVPGDEQSAVRAAFALSYTALKPAASRLFRLGGLLPLPEVALPAAAALADLDLPQTRALLSDLADAHLIEELPAGRYAWHDLLHLYAAELTAASAERAAATHRLYDFHPRTASAAAAVLYPQMQRLPGDGGPPGRTFGDPAAALAWLDAERPTMVALVRGGAATPALRRPTWLLADILRGYFWTRRHADDWLTTAAGGLAAAEAADDPHGRAAAQLSLAQANRSLSRHEAAVGHFAAARTDAGLAGWRQGEAAALGSLANLFRDQGRLSEAAEHHQQALQIYRETGGRGGEAVSLGNLGNVLVELGDLAAGIDRLTESMALYRTLGSANGQAMMHNSLGYAHLGAGRITEARGEFDRALTLHREAGSPEGEADTMVNMGEAHREANAYAAATDLARAGLELAVEVGDRRIQADAHNLLGGIATRQNELAEAVDRHREALRLAGEAGHGRGAAAALIGLAEADLPAGRTAEAYDGAREALAATRRTGLGMLEADALTVLATAALAGAARVSEAAELAEQARDAHRRIGHPAKERLAQRLLDQALELA